MEHGPNFKVRVKTKTWPCCVLGKSKSFGILYLPLSITHSLNTVISSRFQELLTQPGLQGLDSDFC